MQKYVHLFTFKLYKDFPLRKTLIHKIFFNIITSTPAHTYSKHLAEHIGKCAHVCFSYYALLTIIYNMTDHRTIIPLRQTRIFIITKYICIIMSCAVSPGTWHDGRWSHCCLYEPHSPTFWLWRCNRWVFRFFPLLVATRRPHHHFTYIRGARTCRKNPLNNIMRPKPSETKRHVVWFRIVLVNEQYVCGDS